MNIRLDGHNKFHVACIKGDEETMQTMIKNDDPMICQTNGEGLLGLSLYYEYGGKNEEFLKIASCSSSMNFDNVFIHILHNVDILEYYLDNIKIEPYVWVREHHIAIRLITHAEREDNTRERYLKCVLKLCAKGMNRPHLVQTALNEKAIKSLEYLAATETFEEPIRRNIKAFLTSALKIANIDIINLLMGFVRKMTATEINEVLKYQTRWGERVICLMINSGNKNLVNFAVSALKKWRRESDNQDIHRETEESNSTYLHTILAHPQSCKMIDAVCYFIQYGDMNVVNYVGDTCSHLLFSKDFWVHEKIISVLRNKVINPYIRDMRGNDVFSLIGESDKALFQTLNLKETREKTDIVLCGPKIPNIYSGNFNPDARTTMSLTKYIERPDVFVPYRIYTKQKQQLTHVKNESALASLFVGSGLLSKYVSYYTELMYSYSASLIFWYNKYVSYFPPDIQEILEKNDKRFVYMEIIIAFDTRTSHANCILYDTELKTVWRFEPYGIDEVAPDGKQLDERIEELFTNVYGPVTYNKPSDILANTKFQTVDGEDDYDRRSDGDPLGYCLAWCVWFVDIVTTNLKKNNVDVQYILENYIAPEQKKSRNLYLEYIRRYGAYLTEKRNEYFRDLGIDLNLVHNNVWDRDVLKKLTNALLVYE